MNFDDQKTDTGRIKEALVRAKRAGVLTEVVTQTILEVQEGYTIPQALESALSEWEA